MSSQKFVREQKIGIIALQKTHLSKMDEDPINQLPGSRLFVVLSIDPNQSNAKGAALVLNKNIMDMSQVKSIGLVLGRALLCTIGWHKEHKLMILEITQSLKDKPNLDVMLSDFNLVEDPLDHLPPKHDIFSATNALIDGWRHENPDSLRYSFAQSAQQGGRQSRIDHIYVRENFIPFNYLSNIRSPFVGKGRWALPLHVLKDKKLGRQLQKDIISSKTNRSDEYNPQIVFKIFKTKVITLCRDTAKNSKHPSMTQHSQRKSSN
ncbi:uncharacterized protein F5147DRAFT_748452 [Suillus discolor]|uniref:Endonuclease/exonuclease/phosphatase domain-containing protein n=1 Tax=Suillus discolor TaxID=1912936 RepID=A0A9P7ETT5_9AGAM|nr:uncharacterized protein F5147DRAFT_748452 [Suillus discolor]KAG2088278.1 hypothetical protein F5147DRAFT_748452 [Suillus discolor]